MASAPERCGEEVRARSHRLGIRDEEQSRTLAVVESFIGEQDVLGAVWTGRDGEHPETVEVEQCRVQLLNPVPRIARTVQHKCCPLSPNSRRPANTTLDRGT